MPVGPATPRHLHAFRCWQHDNTVGLPRSLTAYDNGGCLMVNTGQVKIAPSGQAPHTIGFTWWSIL